MIDDLHHVIEESKAGVLDALLVASLADTLALPTGSQKVDRAPSLEVGLKDGRLGCVLYVV